ncbi:MAG: hypothetical protein AAF805_08925 [Planctomycetota bacterium]
MPAVAERTVVTAWPSICEGAWGRSLGQVYSWRAGVRVGGVPLTLGWLLVLLTAPLAALLYLGRKAPRKPFVLFGPINRDCLRYRITTRRVVIEHPMERRAAPVAELPLADFDEAAIEPRPGQTWFDAADVVLLAGGEERLRLAGIARPEPFVQTLLKTQSAFVQRRPSAERQAGRPRGD